MILRLEKSRTDNWTKRKFFEGTSAKIGPSIDASGHPVTGLTPAEEKKFEKELGLPVGTLGKGSPYWSDFIIVVDAEGVRFDDSIAEDQLKVKFLRAQSLVAKGTKELMTNPKAEYTLFSEEEEKATRVLANRTKHSALKLAYSMDEHEMKSMVYMFGHNPAGMNEDAIEAFVCERAEADPKGFKLLAEDPKKETKVFVHKLVKVGILELRGGAYLYNDETLGYGIDAVSLMLEDNKTQDLRIALEKQLTEV